MSPLILNLDARYLWAINARPSTHCTDGWVDTRNTLDVWGEERYS